MLRPIPSQCNCLLNISYYAFHCYNCLLSGDLGLCVQFPSKDLTVPWLFLRIDCAVSMVEGPKNASPALNAVLFAGDSMNKNSVCISETLSMRDCHQWCCPFSCFLPFWVLSSAESVKVPEQRKRAFLPI